MPTAMVGATSAPVASPPPRAITSAQIASVRMLTIGQVQGDVTQGIGQAMFAHTVYDRQSGQLLSGSFTDYAVPRADDLPQLYITLAELPTAVNQLGVKGAGQAGCMAAAPPTIINAILDALAPLGVAHIDMPATPERVWRAIRSAIDQ
jgi:carbon-monoxide dehydrogenase large subunit